MNRDPYFEMLERIPPELESIHVRLTNWGIWSRDRFKKGHCRSIEHKWKPILGDVYSDDLSPIEYWNPLDAEKVYGAVRQLPEKHRWLINLAYVFPVSMTHADKRKKVCMRLGVHSSKLPSEINRGRKMVENILKSCYK